MLQEKLNSEFSPIANEFVYSFFPVKELNKLKVSKKFRNHIASKEGTLAAQQLEQIYAADKDDPRLAHVTSKEVSAKAIYLVQVAFYNLYDKYAKRAISKDGAWTSDEAYYQFNHIKNIIQQGWLVLFIAGKTLKLSAALKLPTGVGDLVEKDKCTPEEALKLTQLQADALLLLGLSKKVALNPTFTKADYDIAVSVSGSMSKISLSNLTLEWLRGERGESTKIPAVTDSSATRFILDQSKTKQEIGTAQTACCVIS